MQFSTAVADFRAHAAPLLFRGDKWPFLMKLGNEAASVTLESLESLEFQAL